MGNGWRARPFAVVAESGNRIFLTHVNQAAIEAGIGAGMMLGDARAICPGLATRPGDGVADRRFLHALARLCRRFTPLVALDGGDGLMLDVTGCDHLFGGPDALLSALLRTLRAVVPDVRAAMAPTPGAAAALARYGGNGRIAGAFEVRDALRTLPVQALRPDAATGATLMRLGLERIGDLYPLSTAALSRRFGNHLVRRLARALGAESEPLSFLTGRKRHDAVLGFGEPIFLMHQIEAASQHLLERLCSALEHDGLGCRHLTLTIERVDASAQSLVIATAEPVRSAGHLMTLLRERLNGFEVRFGVERMHLEATRTVRLEGVPKSFAGIEIAAPARTGTALARLVDRLANRLGFDHVQTFAPAESHCPERAFVVHSARFTERPNAPWHLTPARPLRLLTHPEPLYDFCREHFSWHREQRRIVAMTGPERIAAEWWWDDPAWPAATRDYWRIADERGNRFWIYRTAAPGTERRWYLHGFFA